MSIERMEHEGFSSGEAQGRLRVPRYIGGALGNTARKGARRLRYRTYGASRAPRASGMLIKAGLCAAVCAGVLLLRWAQGPDADLSATGLRQALESAGDTLENGIDDTLGRLKFVELPSIIEVFSTNARPDLGLAYESAQLDDESLRATLTLSAAQELYAPAACKVKEMGEDAALGGYLRLVLLDADQEVVYYGLSEISVEEGQVLAMKDSLAKAEESLVLAVYSAGRPTDPIAYFGLDMERV